MLKLYENGQPFVVRVQPVGDDGVQILSSASTLDEAVGEINLSAEVFGRGDVVHVTTLPIAGHRQLLAVYHARMDDPMLLVFCPPEANDVYPVVDAIDGSGSVLGDAISDVEAMLIANLVYDGAVSEAILYENVPVGDLTYPYAWVAMVDEGATSDTIRVVVDVTYDLNGECIHELAASVQQVFEAAIESGEIPVAFTDSPAVAVSFETSSSVVVGDDDLETDVEGDGAGSVYAQPVVNEDPSELYDQPPRVDMHSDHDLLTLGLDGDANQNWRFA